MIKITKSNQHYRNVTDWLDTIHHFSFANYFDPTKMNYGPLRVFNDDIVQPATGFDLHSHRDMEIITYVIQGKLEHKDNQGNHGIIKKGEIQTMTAGSGIMHSEYNPSQTEPLRLLQIWILSEKKGLKPSWNQRKFTNDERLNSLLPIVTGINSNVENTLRINQDVKVYTSSLENNKHLDYKLQENRKSYMFVIDGSVKVNDQALETRDSAMIENENISIVAQKPSEIILIDLPENFLVNQ
ncbi:MAG: pirin family protein [Thaumarchaeota archaeon]|nr:pirin family protein [Nitrososphaerota archaeon]